MDNATEDAGPHRNHTALQPYIKLDLTDSMAYYDMMINFKVFSDGIWSERSLDNEPCCDHDRMD